MYTILFIDEEQDALDRFANYIDTVAAGERVNIITRFPLENLDGMIQTILEHNPDAIITDFMLNEKKTDIKYTVPYNGVDLVEAFTKIRHLFPCFILTSFDIDAMNGSEDVNLVYVKGIMSEDEKNHSCRKGTFFKKVLLQIEHYRAKIQSDQNRLQELITMKKTGNATLKDEEEIIAIDNRLEKVIDSTASLPSDLKATTNTQRLTELLNKADKILDEINGFSKK